MKKHFVLCIITTTLGITLTAMEDHYGHKRARNDAALATHKKQKIEKPYQNDFGAFTRLPLDMIQEFIISLLNSSRTVSDALINLANLQQVNKSFYTFIYANIRRSDAIKKQLQERVKQELEVCYPATDGCSSLHVAVYQFDENFLQSYVPLLCSLGMHEIINQQDDERNQTPMELVISEYIIALCESISRSEYNTFIVLLDLFNENGGQCGNSHLPSLMLNAASDQFINKTLARCENAQKFYHNAKRYPCPHGHHNIDFARQLRSFIRTHHQCNNCFPDNHNFYE